MKKSTIWILGIVMGLSFLSLLYLQVSYIEEMVKMRNEQFDESVKRSLYQVFLFFSICFTRLGFFNLPNYIEKPQSSKTY